MTPIDLQTTIVNNRRKLPSKKHKQGFEKNKISIKNQVFLINSEKSVYRECFYFLFHV